MAAYLLARQQEIAAEVAKIADLLKEKAILEKNGQVLKTLVAQGHAEKTELENELRGLRIAIEKAEAELVALGVKNEEAIKLIAENAKPLMEMKAREEAVAKREAAVMEKFKRAGIPY